MDIKVFSTPTCPYCSRVKEYLTSKGADYEDIDLSSNQEAVGEMVRLSGQMGVPVVVIGEEVVVGFDKERLDELIDKK